MLAAWLLTPARAHASPPVETPACDPANDESCSEPFPEPQTAVEWYARGIELANVEQFAAAAEAFLRSYELQPTSEALFNAALAQENAGAILDAIASYERFLAEPARAEQLVEPAERSIEQLMREVAVLKGLRIHEERPPVQLWIDGQVVELDAFPILVLPGEIEIEVADAQGKHAREFYELAAGEALIVDLRALLPLPVEPPKPEVVTDTGPSADELAAARTHARKAKRLRAVTWGGVALTGATAVGAVTVGVLALREDRLYGTDTCLEYDDGICPSDFQVGEAEAHFFRYRGLVISSTVLAGVSGAAALTTLIVGLVSVRHERASRIGQRGRANVRLRPVLGGLSLSF